MRLAMITGRLNCQISSRTMSRADAKHLPNAALLCPALGSEGGRPEQSQAANHHGQDRERSEDLPACFLLVVSLSNDVVHELDHQGSKMIGTEKSDGESHGHNKGRAMRSLPANSGFTHAEPSMQVQHSQATAAPAEDSLPKQVAANRYIYCRIRRQP